jgi:polyhydroxyalkanoate synthesis regulator phasin
MENRNPSVSGPAGTKVPRRLNKLVESGRITAEEAERLRAGDTDAVVGIRVRHATARLDRAVEAGEMTKEQADRLLAQLQAGEHPAELRAELNRLVRG